MDTKRKWYIHVGIFLLWAISSALSLWLLVVTHQALLVSMATLYVGDDIVRGWQARFFDRAFFVIAGLAWLIGVFIIEGYLKNGLKKQDVWRRAARVFGIELSVLFIADLLIKVTGGITGGTLGILLLIAEGLFGGALLALSIISKRKRDSGQV